MMKKWFLIFGYLIAIVPLFIYKDPVLDWLKDDNIYNLPLTICIALLLALVPIVPFGVIAGIIGAKYGPFLGLLLNVSISTMASILLFLSVRGVFRELGRRFLTKFKRIDRFTTLMEDNAFLAVLTARLIPLIPSPAVNVYAGISQIKFSSFLAATIIGKIPVMFVFAVIGEQMFTNISNVFFTISIYVIFLFVVFVFYKFYMTREIR